METWKPVVGFEGWYSVSNYGNVKRHARRWRPTEMLLKLSPSQSGYIQVTLHKESLDRCVKVHVIMARAFFGDPPADKPTVNHIDGDKLNNALTNLEYASSREQVLHALRLGLAPRPKGSAVVWSKLNEANIVDIRNLRASGVKVVSIARRYGVSDGAIRGCLVGGKNWKHVPIG